MQHLHSVDLISGVSHYHIAEEAVLPDDQADALAGTYVDEEHYELLINHDADVWTPEGDLLVRFRKNVLPSRECGRAWKVLRTIHNPATNRGMAAGKHEGKAFINPIKLDGTRSNTDYTAGRLNSAQNRGYYNGKPILKDGTVSNTTRRHISDGLADSSSGIIGSFDRYARFPFCRLTAFTKDNPGDMLKVADYIRAIDKVFCAELPDRYQAQMAMVEQTKSDWIIPGTAFTTCTVNKNFRTAVHKDAGDLKEGFGVLSVLEAGDTYAGCYLVFPKYRVAVDMRTSDVLLCNVHEWHGNTPLIGKKGHYERISVVLYYRAKMHKCGTADEEEFRAKHRKLGDPLYDRDSRPQLVTTDGTEENTDALYDDQLALANMGALGGGGEAQ